jgi:YHYH protein
MSDRNIHDKYDHNHDSHHHRDHLHNHAVDRRAVLRAGGIGLGAALLAACGKAPVSSAPPTPDPTGPPARPSTTGTTQTAAPAPTVAPTASVAPASTAATLAGFEEFAATVKVIAAGDYWLVESNGMPAHNMMVGITSWQQQVAVPQPYTGANAWKIPVNPMLADNPVSAKTSLYRGAIALAVNGVPIFNALNNRGADAFLVGELDEWGGHAGRADDYHYHVAPLHLQRAAGVPIAYALDGFALYGETEPDGSPVAVLDQYNGHVGADGRYHYHGTRTYPYINGGMRGVVTVKGDQIEPQAATRPFRPAGEPLRGATITGFSSPATNAYQLDYSVGGKAARVTYAVSNGSIVFTFTDAAGATRSETYAR